MVSLYQKPTSFGEMRWACNEITIIIDKYYKSESWDDDWSYLVLYETSEDFRVGQDNHYVTFAVRHPGETIGYIKCDGFGKIIDAKFYKDNDDISNAFKNLIDQNIDLLELYKIQFVKCSFNNNRKASERILWFIANFVYHQGYTTDSAKFITSQFKEGYCLHFALMLKSLFGSGKMCWAAPHGHIVYVDNDIAYDIEGVSTFDCEYYIPISYLNRGIRDFTRIPGDKFNMSEEYIQGVIEQYKKDNDLD